MSDNTTVTERRSTCTDCRRGFRGRFGRIERARVRTEGRRSDKHELLVAEGDAAGDYLERLLDILDFDGDIDLDVEGERAVVSIIGDGDVDRLVGERGEVLDALQELTRLAAQRNRTAFAADAGRSGLPGAPAHRAGRARRSDRRAGPRQRRAGHDARDEPVRTQDRSRRRRDRLGSRIIQRRRRASPPGGRQPGFLIDAPPGTVFRRLLLSSARFWGSGARPGLISRMGSSLRPAIRDDGPIDPGWTDRPR